MTQVKNLKSYQATINRLNQADKLKGNKVYQEEKNEPKNTLKKGKTNFDEMQEKLKLTQDNLKDKNREIISQRVQRIIDSSYSISEANAVEFLIKNKIIMETKYSYVRDNKLIHVSRLTFDTPKIKRIIADKNLRLKLKIK